MPIKEKRNQSYFGLNQDLKNEIVALKEQINDLESKNDTLTDKDIVFEDKINPRANMSDLDIDFDTEDLEKDDNLENLINQTQKNTNSNSNKLLDKLNEIDKKAELVEPVEPQETTKNRRSRKNR